MKFENLINVITYSILYYYSLIRKYDITDGLISDVKSTLRRMWNEYMSDIYDEENIDLIGVMRGEYSAVISVNKSSNLFRDITYVITSYFDRVDFVDTEMEVIEVFTYNHIPGMVLTHSQISKIIEFYLNQ